MQTKQLKKVNLSVIIILNISAIEGYFLDLIKNIYKQYTANIICNCENTMLSSVRIKKRMLALTPYIQHCSRRSSHGT